MENLIKIDQNAVTEHIKGVIEKYPIVTAAFLFGSSLDFCRPDSDIDIALLLQNNSLTEKDKDSLCAELESMLSKKNEKRFDICILDNKNAIFSFKVIRKGKMIYCVNHSKVTDYIEKISRKYSEDYPRYKQALDLIAGGAKSGI